MTAEPAAEALPAEALAEEASAIVDGETTLGLARLMGAAYAGVDLAPVWRALAARHAAEPGDAAALLDLSIVMQLSGEGERGLAVQAAALALRRVYRRPHGLADGPRGLALCAPGDFMANTPLDFLLEGSDVDLRVAYLDAHGAPPPELAPHDVAFLAVGESPPAQALLTGVSPALQNWPAPVLNGAPERIAGLTRDGVHALFAEDPHVLNPVVARVDRTGLERMASGAEALPQGVGFPLIARPVASHAGRGLERLASPDDLAAYLILRGEADFYLSPFIDYADADGLFRKQRIVFIQGRAFIAHMAASSHWMVHYLSAGMAESAAKRDEEARFMADFDTDFARRHARAFASLCEKIGLDYFGVDCAELADGRLLLFEADVAMIVHSLDPLPDFAYKKPVMRKLFAAFQAMLAAAGRHP